MVSPQYNAGLFRAGLCSLSSFNLLRIFFILVVFYRTEIVAITDNEEDLCPVDAIVDLTYAVPNDSGFLTESGHFFSNENARYKDGAWKGCICDVEPCLALCPRINVTINGSTYLDDGDENYSMIPSVYNVNLTVDDREDIPTLEKRFRFVLSDPCKGSSAYFLEPDSYESDEYYLLDNGTLFLPRRDKHQERLKDLKSFCLRLRGNDSSYTPRVCAVKVEKDNFVTVKYVGALVGVPFIIATIFVYSVLPELRNIHGTTLRCYLCCLAVTYVALAADRIPPTDYEAGIFCLFLGFTIYFSFIASFFWLNVMCVDMWWRLGGFGSLRSRGKMHDRKKFIGYSIYAWGSAVLLTAFCIGMEFTPEIPDSLIRPGFKMKSCWFSTKIAAALYFFGPVGVIIACNICLFISTSIKIVQHKNQTQRHLNTGDSKRHDDNKQWFSLYLKLSVIMGISWSTEVLSWLWEGPKYLWYFTDMVNALQGFLIFVIFVWKKKIWKSLKKRYKELQFTRKGCSFTSPGNSESPVTTNCSDESTVRCNVSVLGMEELKNSEHPNSCTNTENVVAANDSR